MRIRMTTRLSGADVLYRPGDEEEFPDAEAIRLIEAGIAVPAGPPIERAVAVPVAERRAAPAPRARKKA